MITEIGAAFEVPSDAGFDGGGPEHFGVSRCAAGERLTHQLPQWSAQPMVGGDIEPDFLPLQDRGRQLSLHQILQNRFLAGATYLEARGQGSGELHDAMIQERGPHFDGMSHAHAVDLHQDIVRQIVLLIERQKRRKFLTAPRQLRQNIGESAWVGGAH